MGQHRTQTHFGFNIYTKFVGWTHSYLSHICPIKKIPPHYHSHSRIVVARKLDIGPLKAVVLTFNECHLHLQEIPVVNAINNMKRSIIYNSKKSVLMYWNLGSSQLGRLWLFPNHRYLWYLKDHFTATSRQFILNFVPCKRK